MKTILVLGAFLVSAIASADCGIQLQGQSQRQEIVNGKEKTITAFDVIVTTCNEVSSDDFRILVNGMDHSGFAHTFLMEKNPQPKCKNPSIRTEIVVETTDIPAGFPIIWRHNTTEFDDRH